MSDVFVGSYGPADEPGIHLLSVDESTRRLQLRASFAGVPNPSFLVVHPNGDYLYAVSETGGGTPGRVHAFEISRNAGAIALVALNRRLSGGDHPCHLGIDSGGRWLAVSNYGTGTVTIFPITSDGSLGAMAASQQHAGSGPHPGRQEGPHAHSAVFSPDDRFLIAADLGIDRLVVYEVDSATGDLRRHGEAATRPGAGPRHLVFHPDGGHLFAVNELDNSLTTYGWDPQRGVMNELQALSTVPEGAVESTAADLHVSNSGSHIYVSNRGHNSLAVFEFDAAEGLTRVAVRPCGGEWPRGFGITRPGGHLLVANRHSNDVALLPRLAGGAEVGDPVARMAIAEPSCIAPM